MTQTNDNSSKEYNIWLILVATCLFTFMSTLDGSIVNIAMPMISTSLNIDMSSAEWIVSLYMITICCLLIFWGRVSDSKGKIKIFRIGTFIFIWIFIMRYKYLYRNATHLKNYTSNWS